MASRDGWLLILPASHAGVLTVRRWGHLKWLVNFLAQFKKKFSLFLIKVTLLGLIHPPIDKISA